ncbi:hypothetical protein SRABI106_04881 [Rahnella aquatilis]|nr:hypothetical protein SRABI106_04881 [Rahnella aquatilis]
MGAGLSSGCACGSPSPDCFERRSALSAVLSMSADSSLMMPSFSSSQTTLLRSLLATCSGAVSALATRRPNDTPASLQLFSVSCVDFTGSIRSLNNCQTIFNLSPSQSKTGLRGEKSSFTGANAMPSPSITPAKKALIGSQYLRISNAAATIATPTAITGQVIAPMAATMALPAMLNPALKNPTPAISALIPVMTGQTTNTMAPSTATKPVTAPAIVTRLEANSGFALTQALSLSSQPVAVCVSLRSCSSISLNAVKRSRAKLPCRRATSPDKLSRNVSPIFSAAPLTSPS